MTRYPYLLFDADNTLFDFDEANVTLVPRRVLMPMRALPFTPELFRPASTAVNSADVGALRPRRADEGRDAARSQFREMSEELRAFAAWIHRGLQPRPSRACLSRSTALVPHAAGGRCVS